MTYARRLWPAFRALGPRLGTVPAA